MQGATSMTLEAALLRSKKACPECAGTGIVRQVMPENYLTSNCSVEMVSNACYEEFLLPHDLRLAAEFPCLGIHHCGQSMEPVYPDGSFVYIDEHREPRIGDDVVVVYEGTLYIKTFTTAGLVSYNTNKKRYPTIKVDGWQNVKCVGVVTGRVGDYDILSGQELRDVERAYAAIEE